ncbi:hypothetical protein GCM10010417_39050 [Streptomyces carpaticus]
MPVVPHSVAAARISSGPPGPRVPGAGGAAAAGTAVAEEGEGDAVEDMKSVSCSVGKVRLGETE